MELSNAYNHSRSCTIRTEHSCYPKRAPTTDAERWKVEHGRNDEPHGHTKECEVSGSEYCTSSNLERLTARSGLALGSKIYDKSARGGWQRRLTSRLQLKQRRRDGDQESQRTRHDMEYLDRCSDGAACHGYRRACCTIMSRVPLTRRTKPE